MIKSIRKSKAFRTLVASGIFAAPLALVATPVMAGTTSPVTDTFNVTATVASSCTLGTGGISDLAFGSYDPLAPISATNGQGSTTISVTCSSGTDYSVGLTYGGGAGASQTDRVMTGGSGGTDTLDYNLYTDSGYTNVWYDGADGCSTVPNTSSNCGSGTGNGSSADSFTVYGQIDQAASPTPSTGSYSDTVTVQVYF